MMAFHGTATVVLGLLTVLIVIGAIWLLVSSIRGRR
jgi:hypothetical protein